MHAYIFLYLLTESRSKKCSDTSVYFKVSGPRVQTFYNEKDSYIEAI